VLNLTIRRARRRLLRVLMAGGVLLALAVVAACGSLPGALAPPVVELTGLSLLRAGSDRQDFRVTLRVANPNPIPIPVEDLRFNIRLGGEGLLAGGTSSRMTLPARGEETLRLEVSTDLMSSIRRPTRLRARQLRLRPDRQHGRSGQPLAGRDRDRCAASG
jgi:LEA14-like dessication related protein